MNKPEQLHTHWQNLWPTMDHSVLYIGGRLSQEPQWLARSGCKLIAIDPDRKMLQDDGIVYGSPPQAGPVRWIDDKLPELCACLQLNRQFHRILISLGSWAQVSASQQERALRKLSNFLLPGGTLIFAECSDTSHSARECAPFELDALSQRAKKLGLQLQRTESTPNGEQYISQQTVILQLPDDGSGSLARIRHIAVNDSKSSTYKLALLRTLVRIADAHPGAFNERTDGQVAISLGLVAYYWIRLFKRLLDADLQQNTDTNKGLGFVTDSGWNKLKHLKADDLAIGALFKDEEATAIQTLFLDTIATIQAGPVSFIYQGGKENRLFSIQKCRRRKESFVLLDKSFFNSFGHFILGDELWHCLRVYGCWIEPLLIQQWIGEMQKYKRNRDANISLERYHQALTWLQRDRDTRLVRQRIADLRRHGFLVESVWSDNKAGTLDVDHCLPFAYWPNNDLWNLLPATPKENRSKSDRVPRRARLLKAKRKIVDWWTLAWSENSEKQRFFVEAHLSLPNIPTHCQDFLTVCEAMQDQIIGVQQRMQVGEW